MKLFRRIIAWARRPRPSFWQDQAYEPAVCDCSPWDGWDPADHAAHTDVTR